MAEYAANAPYTSPQKEYGYRNGQLLVTVSLGTVGWGAAPTFDDNPLNPNYPGETTVQARHITQLRTAINSVRTHLGMAAYSWQYSATTSDLISANPILEMRTALDQALGAPSSPGYAAGLASNQPIKAIHIQELRGRVLAVWNSGTTGTDIRWLIADQLGTPRIILDQSGSLASTTRHDYLPFGEELTAGGRTPAIGYTNSDTTRQKFTSYERDDETQLDFAQARYHSNAQGRFTSADPFLLSADLTEPQSWNRYSYVINNPLNLVGPLGLTYVQGPAADDPDEPSHVPMVLPDIEWTVIIINIFEPLDAGKAAAQNAYKAARLASMETEFDNRSSGRASKLPLSPGEGNGDSVVERYMNAPARTALQIADWASRGVRRFGYAVAPDYGYAGFNLPLMAGGNIQLSKDGHLYGSYNVFGITGGNYDNRKNWKAGFQAGAAYFVNRVSETQREDAIQGPGINATAGPIGGYFPLGNGPPAVTVGWPFTNLGVNVSHTKKIF